MRIAIHMGRNREHIGSKETVKSLCIAREEMAGSEGRRLRADRGGLPPVYPKLLNLNHLQSIPGLRLLRAYMATPKAVAPKKTSRRQHKLRKTKHFRS
jgi:hypothetical protein